MVGARTLHLGQESDGCDALQRAARPHERLLAEDALQDAQADSLTDTGKSLIPTLEQLISWAKAHFEEVVRP